MRYVTYNEDGVLTGCFLQDVLPEHQDCYKEVGDSFAYEWVNYRLDESGELSLIPPPSPPLPTLGEYTTYIQTMLDSKAQERLYDNILSACTYATSTIPKFQAEGQACVNWRDAVWHEAYSLLEQVKNGDIPQPTLQELADMLPTMLWPDEEALPLEE